MKRYLSVTIMALAVAGGVQEALALSEKLHRPKIFWPKTYHTNKAARVEQVLTSPEFKYLDGMTSYWEPKWSTTLAYSGDAQALSAFITALNEVQGIDVRLTASRDLAKESRGSLPSGSWWVEYWHTMPNTVTVRINLAAASLGGDAFELTLPKPKAKP